MDPISIFLTKELLHEDQWIALQIQQYAVRFTFLNGKLYKRSYLGPSNKCVTPEEGNIILKEIHEGLCSNHYDSRALARKVLLLEYFWPTII